MLRIAQNAAKSVIIKLIRFTGRLSDPNVMRLLRLAGKAAALTGNRDMESGIREVMDCWEMGPPYTDLVRRMTRESRAEELRDLLEGFFNDPGFRFN